MELKCSTWKHQAVLVEVEIFLGGHNLFGLGRFICVTTKVKGSMEYYTQQFIRRFNVKGGRIIEDTINADIDLAFHRFMRSRYRKCDNIG